MRGLATFKNVKRVGNIGPGVAYWAENIAAEVREKTESQSGGLHTPG